MFFPLRGFSGAAAVCAVVHEKAFIHMWRIRAAASRAWDTDK